MRPFNCPQCDTPISRQECSCGFGFPDHVIRQIEAYQRLPEPDSRLEARLKPRFHRRSPAMLAERR